MAVTTSIRKENASEFAVVVKAAAHPTSQTRVVRVAASHKDRRVIVLLVRETVDQQTEHRVIVRRATALRQPDNGKPHLVTVIVRKARDRVTVQPHQRIVPPVRVQAKTKVATTPIGVERATPPVRTTIVRVVERAIMLTGVATMPTEVELATTPIAEEPVVVKHRPRPMFKNPFSKRTHGCAVTRQTVGPIVGVTVVVSAKMIAV
ncbi:hypothetical protein GCM10028816_10350 [Spirosoma lituiforme]